MIQFKWRYHVIRWLLHLLLLSAYSNTAELSSRSPLFVNNSTREVPLKLSSPSTSAIVSDRAITSKPTPATTTPSLNQILNENIVHIPLPVTPTSQPETGEGAAGVRPVSELINATVLHNTSVANHTDGLAAQTSQNTSSTTTSTVKPTTEAVKNTTEATEDVLPEAGAAEEEHHNSMSIFLVLAIIGLCILMIHYMTRSKLRFLPESVAVVFLGALIGLILQILSKSGIANWQREEAFSPTVFFLIILPPIIFESGYNLHKGNFFQNFGTILLFAVIGTSISALVVGGGIYLLGVAEVAYQLSFVESFAFGSLISAVDPVATLAIFNALDVDPVLNMLVFGESILNDAVAIVLTTTALESGSAAMATTTPSHAVLHAVGRFCGVFGASAALGTVSALLAALLLKHVDLRNNPSLEFAMMLIFIYAPYGLAEGVHLSGIMAILFCGVVMSHYTHYNLSPVTQITMQHTMRTVAFVAETCVFAYLGLAIFSFRHSVQMALVVWSLVLCLLGRALNIFPLSAIANYFRQHKITYKMQCIMWFSGLRGVIAYALCLHLEFDTEKRHVLVTTTLIVVLSTILVLGGSTKPLLKFLRADRRENRSRRRRKNCRQRDLNMSKSLELGTAIDSEYLSELTEDEQRDSSSITHQLTGFSRLDCKYFIPFFRRRLTQQELRDARTQMTDLTNKVYQSIRVVPSDEEHDGEDERTLDSQRLITSTNSI